MMKKFLVLMAAAACLLFTGCGDSPKATAEGWRDAIIELDLDKANSYSTASTQIINSIIIMALKEDSSGIEELKKLEFTSEEIDGDTAKVYGPEGEPITLVKQDGKWLIDVEKE